MSNVSIKKTTNLFPAVKPLALVICALLSTGLATQVVAAPGDRIGEEFIVNTFTSQQQQEPSIAMNAEGSSVVTWASRLQPSTNNNYDIYAQRYAVDGSKAGDEFIVNTNTISDQRNPSIAIDNNGDFVIVWRSHQGNGDYDIYGQRYNANGTIAGDEFLVNTNMVGEQQKPQVAMDTDGDFVVTWESGDSNVADVYGQRYQSDGNTLGGEFMVNTATNNGQLNPSIAMDGNGAFVVTWDSYAQEPLTPNGSTLTGVYAQRFDIFGNKVGAEFLVNTETAENQSNPSIAMKSDGTFVIVWQSDIQDTDDFDIYAQRYNSNGTTVGGEFQVNTETNESQENPAVAIDADGDFVVTWQSLSQDSTLVSDGFGVYGQRYNADGITLGDEFLVNTEVDDHQQNPVVAMDDNGNFVITWQSNIQVEGGVIDVFAQRYEGKMNNSTTNVGSNSTAGGSGGSLSWLMGVLLLPLMFRIKRKA